jgi:hypothetical protein
MKIEELGSITGLDGAKLDAMAIVRHLEALGLVERREGVVRATADAL